MWLVHLLPTMSHKWKKAVALCFRVIPVNLLFLCEFPDLWGKGEEKKKRYNLNKKMSILCIFSVVNLFPGSHVTLRSNGQSFLLRNNTIGS